MTLTEFLLARIAEERALAEETLEAGKRRYQESPPNYAEIVNERTAYEPDDGWLSTSPVRVLAECEAKRRIVEIAQEGDQHDGDDIKPWLMARELLTALALPYADHPDFREEWRA